MLTWCNPGAAPSGSQPPGQHLDVPLDRFQQAVVDHRLGPASVVAVPGSGKTSTLVAHVRSVLGDGISPGAVLVITFSRSAADVFHRRLVATGAPGAASVKVRTFHGHALHILKHAGLWPNRHRILDERHGASLWHEVAGPPTQACPEAVGPIDVDVDELAAAVDQVRLFGGDPARSDTLLIHERAAARAYARLKSRRGLVDFTDLVQQAVACLEDPGRHHKVWWPQVLLVDEAQDTNRLQMRLVELLSQRSSHLLVVGDPKQAIYGFQGADPTALTEFPTRFPRSTVYSLPVSYRVPPAVAAAANAMMAEFADPSIVDDIVSASPTRGAVLTARHADEVDEAIWVATQAAELSSQDRQMLILGRTNMDLEPVAAALSSQRIDFRQMGAGGFWTLPEIDGLLDVARLAKDPTNVAAACRLSLWPSPKRKDFAAEIGAVLAAGGAPMGYRALAEMNGRAERVATMILSALRHGEAGGPGMLYGELMSSGVWKRFLPPYLKERGMRTVPSFLATASLTRSVDALLAKASLDPPEPQQSKVTLATAHGSKGMEADVVIVVGAEMGRFPHTRSIGVGEQAEELRLLYVALTRAKQICVLSWADVRGTTERLLCPWVQWLGDTLALPDIGEGAVADWMASPLAGVTR